jgi:hypothetical protein
MRGPPSLLLRAGPRSRGARAAAAASSQSFARRRRVLPPRLPATGEGGVGRREGEQLPIPPPPSGTSIRRRGGRLPVEEVGSEGGRRRRNRGGAATARNSMDTGKLPVIVFAEVASLFQAMSSSSPCTRAPPEGVRSSARRLRLAAVPEPALPESPMMWSKGGVRRPTGALAPALSGVCAEAAAVPRLGSSPVRLHGGRRSSLRAPGGRRCSLRFQP